MSVPVNYYLWTISVGPASINASVSHQVHWFNQGLRCYRCAFFIMHDYNYRHWDKRDICLPQFEKVSHTL